MRLSQLFKKSPPKAKRNDIASKEDLLAFLQDLTDFHRQEQELIMAKDLEKLAQGMDQKEYLSERLKKAVAWVREQVHLKNLSPEDKEEIKGHLKVFEKIEEENTRALETLHEKNQDALNFFCQMVQESQSNRAEKMGTYTVTGDTKKAHVMGSIHRGMRA